MLRHTGTHLDILTHGKLTGMDGGILISKRTEVTGCPFKIILYFFASSISCVITRISQWLVG